VFSVVLQYFCSKKQKNGTTEYQSIMDKIKVKKDESINDIYQTSMVNTSHKRYVLSEYYQLLKEEIESDRKRSKMLDEVKLLERLLETVVVCSFLVATIIKTGIENVDALTILSVISVLEIYKRFMENVRGIFKIFTDYQVVQERIQEKAKLCEDIFNVYEAKNKKEKKIAQNVKGLELVPFNVGYSLDKDGAKKSFHLSSTKTITLRTGDFVLLSGPSHSGKSTLINIITGNLVFDDINFKINALNSGEINSVIQQDIMQLGSTSVLNEITLGKTEYDKEKLVEILTALHLTQELTTSGENVLEYLAQASNDRFSDGQLQRLTIARTLFNIGDETHIIAFDEATSRLNDEIALQVVNYIKAKYKDSIVLFATHQVNVLKKVATRHFAFEKIEDELSAVTEVELED
jgi:ABC-type transport system involved in cytochrome bd biosynthesis fused ATPase/permease subunit